MKPIVIYEGNRFYLEDKVVSAWRNPDDLKPERTYLNRYIMTSTETEEKIVRYFFSGYNPLPVKGFFESSYPALLKWLLEHGYVQIYVRETKYN